MPRSDVEAIRGERVYCKRDHQFLVKYVGFDEYTWEPAGTILEQVADKVEEYWKRHPAVNMCRGVTIMARAARRQSHASG